MIPNYNHPARTAEMLGIARHRLERPRGLRHRRGRDAPRARRASHPGQGKTRDVAGGRRAGRQHDGARALPGLRGQILLDAVPQRAAEAGAEAAPADVDGVHEPRHDPGRGRERPRRPRLRVSRSRGGAQVGGDLLRHHQVRECVPLGHTRQLRTSPWSPASRSITIAPKRSAAARRDSSSSSSR